MRSASWWRSACPARRASELVAAPHGRAAARALRRAPVGQVRRDLRLPLMPRPGRALLRHDPDLLRQQRAASRPRVHDDRRRCRRAARAPARRRRLLPHGNRRARRQDRAGRGRRGRSPEGVGRSGRGALPQLAREIEREERLLHPHHRPRARGVRAALRRRCARRRPLRGHVPGLYCTACEAYYTRTDLVDGPLPEHGTRAGWTEEHNTFFRLSAYAEPAARALRRATRLRAAADAPQRGALARRGRSRDVSIARESVHWGVPLPWATDQVIYVWIDALLNYASRAHLRAAWRGSDRALLAGALAAAGQGHPALPRGDLAGHAALGRLRAAAAALHPRDARRSGRPQDVEDARERDGPGPRPSSTARMRCATTCCARSPSARTAASATTACTTATTASSPTSSATSSPAAWRWSTRYRDGVIPRCASSPELVALGARGRDAYERRFDGSTSPARSSAVWELVRALNRFVEERAPWELAKRGAATRRRALDETLATLCEGVRTWRCCCGRSCRRRRRCMLAAVGEAGGASASTAPRSARRGQAVDASARAALPAHRRARSA